MGLTAMNSLVGSVGGTDADSCHGQLQPGLPGGKAYTSRPWFDSRFRRRTFSRWSHANDVKLILHWLHCQVLALKSQCSDWSARCQYSVTG